MLLETNIERLSVQPEMHFRKSDVRVYIGVWLFLDILWTYNLHEVIQSTSNSVNTTLSEFLIGYLFKKFTLEQENLNHFRWAFTHAHCTQNGDGADDKASM